MKILFKLSGSKKIGFGHISRSYALAQSLIKNNIDIIFWITSPNMQDVKKLVSKIKVIDSNKYKIDIGTYVVKKSIDIIIFDELKLNIGLLRYLKKNSKAKLIGLDYFHYKNNQTDLIINLYNHNKKDLTKNFINLNKYIEGLKFAIIREKLIKKKFNKTNIIKKKINKIMVSFGGGDRKNHAYQVLKWLSSINFKGNIVISKHLYDKPVSKFINLINNDDLKLKMIDMGLNFDNEIINCDIIFCGGGTTLLESCYLGLPTVVMPQNHREYIFSKLIERNKAALVTLNPYKDEIKVKKLIYSHKLRRLMKKAQTTLVDGRGKERIIKAILEI